ncbi:MAG: adenylyl-sulfate kinase [bacterium]
MEKGALIWFTGIPASGKSTIGRALCEELRKKGFKVENLDADEIRANISPDLGYTPEARDLNTKRLAFLGKLLCRNGVFAVVAAVSPLRFHRDRARSMVDYFVEVFVKASVETCKKRDPKGLYKRAERGEVKDIAGIHMPYEEPLKPEVICNTEAEDVDTCVRKIIATMETLGYLPKAAGEAPTVGAEEEEKIKQRLRGLGYIE